MLCFVQIPFVRVNRFALISTSPKNPRLFNSAEDYETCLVLLFLLGYISKKETADYPILFHFKASHESFKIWLWC